MTYKASPVSCLHQEDCQAQDSEAHWKADQNIRKVRLFCINQIIYTVRIFTGLTVNSQQCVYGVAKIFRETNQWKTWANPSVNPSSWAAEQPSLCKNFCTRKPTVITEDQE